MGPRFDPKAETFEHFYARDGLPGSVVYSILEDDLGFMWLGTGAGLSRFQRDAPPEKRFRNFDLSDDIGNLLTMNVPLPGNAVDEQVVFEGFTPAEDITVKQIGIFAKTGSSGADIQIDLLKDGAEETKVATLTAGQTYEKTDITDAEYTSSERLGLKYKQIGSTVSGADLVVTLYYAKKPIPSAT